MKKTAFARKLREPKYGAAADKVPADQLRKGDIVLVEASDIIPCDGEVIEGGASVDESAITGESAPVIRESGGDFASVTGGTRILSDWLVIECSVNPGETFLDRMIAMVEERDCPDHSPDCPDYRLFTGNRHAVAVFRVGR